MSQHRYTYPLNVSDQRQIPGGWSPDGNWITYQSDYDGNEQWDLFAVSTLTGEVRKDLDIQSAGEWFARILFSLFSTPSSTLDMDNPDVVADFVRAHVVRGFANDRPRPRRGIDTR